MIIEIDGFFLNKKLLSTEEYQINEIRVIYEKHKKEMSKVEEIFEIFIKEYGMTELIEDTVRSDLVLDIDTDRIYKPR